MSKERRTSYDGAVAALSEITAERADVALIELSNKKKMGEITKLGGLSMASSAESAVSVASGMAIEGQRVFILSENAPHFIARSYEQIRSSVAIPNQKVVILSIHDSASCDGDGAPRQMWEDFALMRAMPNMRVMAASDWTSAYAIIMNAVRDGHPAYVRLSRAKARDIYETGDDDFHVGGARRLTDGDGVTILSCGVMAGEALIAANILSQQGMSAEVIDCYSIKPFPERMLVASARRTGCCVVAEKHATAGGLYGAVTECLCRNYTVPVRQVAINDTFGQSGLPEEIDEYYGLTRKEIVHNVIQVWAMRRR
ncbi:transketolase [Synergistales bacterium]|nr:transketolase [Synergistales bacterium]